MWLDHRGKTKLIHASKNLHFSHYVRSKVPTVTQNTEFRCHSIPTPHGHTCACFQWPYTQNMQNLLLPYTLLVFSGYTHSLWCISYSEIHPVQRPLRSWSIWPEKIIVILSFNRHHITAARHVLTTPNFVVASPIGFGSEQILIAHINSGTMLQHSKWNDKG